MQIDKKGVTKISLAVYVIASLLFIAYVAWQNFVYRYSQAAFTQGQENTINQFITQAQAESCLPFAVYNATTSVQVINTACLENKEAEQQTETTN